MDKLSNSVRGYNLCIKRDWDGFLEANRCHLRSSIDVARASQKIFSSELLLSRKTSDLDYLRMCILINELPEYQWLKLDLKQEMWKRFFHPHLLYEDKRSQLLETIHSDQHDIISRSLRLSNANLEVRYERPFDIDCVGFRVDDVDSKILYLQLVYLLLLSDERERIIERFLYFIENQNLGDWLFGTVLNRRTLRRQYLFEFRPIDRRPAKKVQRKRGYTDKGTLRDSTIPRPEPFPFAESESLFLETAAELALESLVFLRQRLDDGLEHSKPDNFENLTTEV